MMKFICSCALLVGITARGDSLSFQSGEQQTALLELYTSEGCSSCPPAESWLSKLKDAPGLWTEFVPVAFHVAYWNNLGWRDKLSSDQYSARQQAYANSWSAENIYTPEFVLNGKEWQSWFGLRRIPSLSANTNGTLKVWSNDDKHWQAGFAPTTPGAGSYEITAALLVSDVKSDVENGENAGRHLNHDFAALSLITRPLASQANTGQTSVGQTNEFQGSFVIDDKPKGITGHLALAVWVTRSGQLEPLQAAGGWLPMPEKN